MSCVKLRLLTSHIIRAVKQKSAKKMLQAVGSSLSLTVCLLGFACRSGV